MSREGLRKWADNQAAIEIPAASISQCLEKACSDRGPDQHPRTTDKVPAGLADPAAYIFCERIHVGGVGPARVNWPATTDPNPSQRHAALDLAK
jgi:hypothetical protein